MSKYKIISVEQNDVLIRSNILVHQPPEGQHSEPATCVMEYKYQNNFNDNNISLALSSYSNQELYLLNGYEKILNLYNQEINNIAYNTIYNNYVLSDTARVPLTIFDKSFLQNRNLKSLNNTIKDNFATFAYLNFKALNKKQHILHFLESNNIYDTILSQFSVLLNNQYLSLNKNLFNTADLAVNYIAALSKYSNILDLKNSDDDLPYEVVGYKIEKYQFDNPNAIRTWILPYTDSPNSEHIQFCDTEIMYGKRYKYKISLLLICLGIKNEEVNPFLISTDSIVFDNKILIKNSPPLKPNINILTYMGVDNKILILAKGNAGVIKEEPKYLNSNTRSIYSLFSAPDNKINFESKNEEKSFSLYRLENPPKQYLDFENAKKINFDASSYVDTIVPNKKYYYTFTTRDFFNIDSNPTDVYEVEILNDNGVIQPIVKNYFFKPITQYDFKRHFRKKINLSPAPLNLLVNNKTVDTIKDKIGVGENLCWDKEFIVVISSLTTGKKINFKIKYTKEEEK